MQTEKVFRLILTHICYSYFKHLKHMVDEATYNAMFLTTDLSK